MVWRKFVSESEGLEDNGVGRQVFSTLLCGCIPSVGTAVQAHEAGICHRGRPTGPEGRAQASLTATQAALDLKFPLRLSMALSEPVYWNREPRKPVSRCLDEGQGRELTTALL